MRALLSMKRGSAISSDSTSAAMCSQLPWLAPPMLIQPSAVGKAWYGAARTCADPPGPGEMPMAKKIAAC
jgi:hypothetical protein